MFDIWVPITVLAAFSQNIRSALQKHLTNKLSNAAATQVRFFYALPFALLYLTFLCYGMGYNLPKTNGNFFLYVVIGALAQITATVFLVSLFSHRNFFVGTAYSKTETVQTAILGFLVLSDPLSMGAVTGIGIGLLGVIIISNTKSKTNLFDILKGLKTKAALMGMASGFFFGITAVSIRAASLSLEGGFVIQAAFTLCAILLLQSLTVFLYLVMKEPGEMTSVLVNWRISWLVGLAGMIASVCWFSAMTIENAAHVRAVGQIELVFAFLASLILFKEKTNKMELIGVSIIVIGVLVLLLTK